MRRRVRCAFDRAADDATIVLRGRCPARDGVMRDWKITLRGVLGARGKVKTVLASAQVVA